MACLTIGNCIFNIVDDRSCIAKGNFDLQDKNESRAPLYNMEDTTET